MSCVIRYILQVCKSYTSTICERIWICYEKNNDKIVLIIKDNILLINKIHF